MIKRISEENELASSRPIILSTTIKAKSDSDLNKQNIRTKNLRATTKDAPSNFATAHEEE